MSLKLVANHRAHVALLAALPALGITLAQGQTVEQALQTRLAGSAPSPEQIGAGVSAFLVGHGLPVAAGQTPDQALTAFLSGHGIDIAAGQTLKQAVESFLSGVGELETQLTAANARADLFAATLAAKGVKVVAKDPTKGITAADIDAALEARVSTRAGELLAQTGTPPVVSTPGAASPSVKTPVATAGKEIDAVASIYAERRAGGAKR